MARLRSATGNTFAQYKAPGFTTQEAKMAKYASHIPPPGAEPQAPEPELSEIDLQCGTPHVC